MTAPGLPPLERLEAESLHIIREVAAEARRPVLLYSIGKDSAVLLHLARKAFWPAPPPFPLLHVDTGWKFRDMYAMRDRMAAESGMALIVHRNAEAVARDINPFDHGSLHTTLWKTEGLKQALDAHGFDAAFGGARRDEDRSRAKERIVSLRAPGHGWDPRRQRPELWNLYNVDRAPGESLRVFPLSNWTELDIWTYIARNAIPVVPLYFSAPRPTVERDGLILMVDDARFRLHPGEQVVERHIRFRTLGCYPLTGAMESRAMDVDGILREIGAATTSERLGRTIDREEGAISLERRKQEGYF